MPQKKEETVKDKVQIDFVEAHSLRELLKKVNSYNEERPGEAIRKEDIVQVIKEEGTYILLYYR